MASDKAGLVEALEKQWRDALCARNIERLCTLVHPDFILIGTRGAEPFTLSRADWLEAIQKREVVDIKLTITDAVVFDQVMVGTVHARWVVRYLDKQFDDCVLLTDVWVCENDRWQVVRRHSSPLPSSQCLAAS